MANSQTLSNDLYDPETGQQLFHPLVGRGPRTQKRPGIGQGQTNKHLYHAGQVLNMKKQHKQAEKEAKVINDSKKVFTTNSTSKIMQKKKQDAFCRIFEWLDSDRDGEISAEKIDISPLSADLLEVLSPLFVEMEELSQALDAEEFIDAVGRLYESLSMPDKNVLLLKPTKRERSASNKRKHGAAYNFQVSNSNHFIHLNVVQP